MSYTVTYKYSKNHPEDLFEFLEFYEKSRGKVLIDIRPHGLAFREVNEPYKKSVDVFVSNSDKTGQIVELDYTDLSDLETKLQSFN